MRADYFGTEKTMSWNELTQGRVRLIAPFSKDGYGRSGFITAGLLSSSAE
jgi:hypothetical protein